MSGRALLYNGGGPIAWLLRIYVPGPSSFNVEKLFSKNLKILKTFIYLYERTIKD
jgi:hypothetical protein